MLSNSDYCRRCGRQATRFAIINDRCPSCFDEELSFDSIARCFVYEDIARSMILRFKMSGRTEFSAAFHLALTAALESADFYDRIDFFVPVPMHWRKRLFRGYNQSYLLAKKLKHPRAELSTDLVRTRRTKPQAGFSDLKKRQKNISGAFGLRRGHDFAGRNVCLVDDIKTTGATLNECSKILIQAGARHVFALSLSVAGQLP